MFTSRRKFLKTSAFVALSAGIPLKAAAEQIRSGGSNFTPFAEANVATTDFSLDMKSFAASIKSEFIVHNSAGSTAIRLIEVNDLRSKSEKLTANGRECFSTVFRGPQSAPLKQNTYRLEHGTLGSFSVLLVPVGTSNNAFYYEAVFNRLH
jgi:hypothetical protein